MQYNTLGRTGIPISKICLGCMGLGNPKTGQHSWTVEEEQSRAIIKAALDGGINFFDTAAVYQNGSSEQYLGRALKDFARREEVVVATKFIPISTEELNNGISVHDHILRMLDNSLQNLGMDYVDLYIYHMWDYRADLKEILRTLHEAVQDGRIKALGISNCFAWQLTQANLIAEYEGLTPFSAIQGHLNLIFREEEREMVPCARSFGMSITPYSPLAGGKLSRIEGTTKRFTEDSYLHFKYDATSQADSVIIARTAEIALKHQVPMTTVALAWLIQRGYIPVSGVTKLEQIAGLTAAADFTFTKEELDYLEEAYVPHRLVGVMAQNTAENAAKTQVWNNRSK